MAYQTETIDYGFYFPEAGDFAQFPVHAAADKLIVARDGVGSFNVVEALT